MEGCNVLFPAPPGYAPSFGKNFLQLMEKRRSGRPYRNGLAKIFQIVKKYFRALEAKLESLSNQQSLEDRVQELEQALQSLKISGRI